MRSKILTLVPLVSLFLVGAAPNQVALESAQTTIEILSAQSFGVGEIVQKGAQAECRRKLDRQRRAISVRCGQSAEVLTVYQ